MRIIKLDAIDSTNTFLKQLSAVEKVEDYTVVMANYQTQGKGQMGAKWESQNGENLMVSLFKGLDFMPVERSFYLSMATALSIYKTLKNLGLQHLSIKWPNDILADNKKVCGVLIENVIKHNQLAGSVIGIGLNLNQTNFEGLPQASSLKLLSGVNFNREEVLDKLVTNIKKYFKDLEAGEYDKIKKEYESVLFRKNKPSTFKDVEGRMFMGIIKGVTESGNLELLLEDDVVNTYELKEIKLLY